MDEKFVFSSLPCIIGEEEFATRLQPALESVHQYLLVWHVKQRVTRVDDVKETWRIVALGHITYFEARLGVLVVLRTIPADSDHVGRQVETVNLHTIFLRQKLN